MAIVVVPLIDARAQLDAQRRPWRGDRLRENAAQRLITTRQHGARELTTRQRRRATRGVEVHLVEVALHVAIVATQAQRRQMHPRRPRPNGRRAPIVARNVGHDAAVLGDSTTRADCRRTLMLILLSVPGTHAEQPVRVGADVDAEIDVALIPRLKAERRTDVTVVAELVTRNEGVERR